MATLTTRVATTLAYAFRLAVNRFGVTPVLLVAIAGVAALLSLRRNASNSTRRRRQRRQSPNNSNTAVISNVPDSNDPDPNFILNDTTQPANNNSQSHTPPSQMASASSSSLASQHPSRPSKAPKWLSRIRRVSIGAVCSFSQSSPMFLLERVANADDGKQTDDAQTDQMSTVTKPKVTLPPEVVSPLRSLSSMFEMFVVVRVDDDLLEQAVTDAFASAGLFERGFIDRRKLVFCETDVGRISVARQLESNLHIDENLNIILDLQRFLPMVAMVSPDCFEYPDPPFRNLHRFTSLSALLSS